MTPPGGSKGESRQGREGVEDCRSADVDGPQGKMDGVGCRWTVLKRVMQSADAEIKEDERTAGVK